MNEKFLVGAALPNSMGLCADMLYEVREVRLAMDKEVAKVKARENEIKEYIIENLSKSDDTGAAGKHHRVQVVTKLTPQAKEWPKIHAWIKQHDRFDLLQKRLNNKAVTDMWDENEEVPGVERVNVVDISLTKK